MKQKVFYANRRAMLAVSGAMTLLPGCALARSSRAVETMTFDLQAMLQESGAVGLAGVIWREGQKLWQGQAGRRVSGQEPAIGQEDLWHLGSNTKAMTAALWARLVEQGKARWDMPLAEAVAAAGLEVVLHEGWSDRTVEDFLRHRAGLGDARYVTQGWLRQAQADTRPLHEQRVAFVTPILQAEPDGLLGQYQYGNANYLLVGCLIEGITGLTWEEVMQQELFVPLSMTRAGFGAPQGEQPYGHVHEGTSVHPIAPDGPVSDNPKALGPAGTAHMSLADYGKFLAAMMEPGWLSEDSLTKLITPLEGETYALGWIAPGRRAWAQGPALVHNGSNTMWFATVVLAPAVKLAIVSVSNDGTRGGRACSLLIDKMIETVTSQVK